MKIKPLLTITAILSSINGFLYLLVPEWSLSLIGTETNAVGILNTRYFGAAALGMAAMAWFGREISSWQHQRVIILGLLITLSLSAIAGFEGTLTGDYNFWGWSMVGADALLSAGFLFALVIKHGSD